MSDFTDHTISRYLERDPERRKAYTLDPAVRHEIELTRRTLDAADRAMAEEGVPEDARRRVANRVVWGEPEGRVDVHAKVRERVLAAYDLPVSLTDAWKAILEEDAGPVRPDEEPTT